MPVSTTPRPKPDWGGLFAMIAKAETAFRETLIQSERSPSAAKAVMILRALRTA